MKMPLFWSLVIGFMSLSFSITAAQPEETPESPDELKYTDFIPRYRKIATDFLISKIEYRTTKIVLHFHYVAERDKEAIFFQGKELENNWLLETPKRPGWSSESVSLNSEIINIRINNQLQLSHLPDNEQVRYTPQRGDIISCEIHFEMMPDYVKVANLVGGDLDKHGAPRFTCRDILLKGSDNPMLGTEDDMDGVIRKFYRSLDYVRYPEITQIITLDQEKEFALQREEANKHKGLTGAVEPVDYMPKSFTTESEIHCGERFILKNVYFDDNKTEFSRRVEANRTLSVLAQYAKRHPEMVIVLHGHTDIFGNEYENLSLSKERVFAVKRALVARGVKKDRIVTAYHGGSQPLPLYKNGGTMNRRVEMQVACDQ